MTIIITDNLLLAQIIRQNRTVKDINDAFACLQAVNPDLSKSLLCLINRNVGGFSPEKEQ